jgi:hypothetical protein
MDSFKLASGQLSSDHVMLINKDGCILGRVSRFVLDDHFSRAGGFSDAQCVAIVMANDKAFSRMLVRKFEAAGPERSQNNARLILDLTRADLAQSGEDLTASVVDLPEFWHEPSVRA